MLASIVSALVLGISRMFDDMALKIKDFRENFCLPFHLQINFLLFIYKTSKVLFLVFRRSTSEQLVKVYNVIKLCLAMLLSTILLFYIPTMLILAI